MVRELSVDDDVGIKNENEQGRRDGVVEKFAYVHPEGHFLLKDLLTHMRERVQRTPEEEWLPTHGDLKYDQFMFHNDHFTLLDFDYYAPAETSSARAKFSACPVPTRPRDWRTPARTTHPP